MCYKEDMKTFLIILSFGFFTLTAQAGDKCEKAFLPGKRFYKRLQEVTKSLQEVTKEYFDGRFETEKIKFKDSSWIETEIEMAMEIRERHELITYLEKIGRVNKGMTGKIAIENFHINPTHNRLFTNGRGFNTTNERGQNDLYWVQNRVLMLNDKPLKFGPMYTPDVYPLGLCFNNSNLPKHIELLIKEAMDTWNAKYQVGYNKRALKDPTIKIPKTLFIESCDCDKHFVIQVRAMNSMPKDHWGSYLLKGNLSEITGILQLNSTVLKSGKSNMKEKTTLILHELGHTLGFPDPHVPPQISNLMSAADKGKYFMPLSKRSLTDSDIEYFIDHYVREFGR